MAMNFEQARMNMVENQVRPWEVLDGRVLDVIGRVGITQVGLATKAR